MFKNIIFVFLALIAVCWAIPALQSGNWDDRLQQRRSQPIQMEDTSSNESRERPMNIRVRHYDQQHFSGMQLKEAPEWERAQQQTKQTYHEVRDNVRGERNGNDEVDSDENNSNTHRNKIHKHQH